MGERLLLYMNCPGETSLSRDLKAVREKAHGICRERGFGQRKEQGQRS